MSIIEQQPLRGLAGAFMAVVAILTLVLPGYVLALAVFDFVQPAWVDEIVDKFFSGALLKQADVGALVVGVAPVVVRSVCYSPQTKKLNGLGIFVCLVSVAGVVIAYFAAQHLKNVLGAWSEDTPPPALGGLVVYQNFAQLNDISLSIYLFYLAMFFGFSGKDEKTPEPALSQQPAQDSQAVQNATGAGQSGS